MVNEKLDTDIQLTGYTKLRPIFTQVEIKTSVNEYHWTSPDGKTTRNFNFLTQNAKTKNTAKILKVFKI